MSTIEQSPYAQVMSAQDKLAAAQVSLLSAVTAVAGAADRPANVHAALAQQLLLESAAEGGAGAADAKALLAAVDWDQAKAAPQ